MILMKKILRTFLFVAMLGGIVSVAASCSDDESERVDYGTVTGIVLDEMDAPISGVTVTISGVEETVTTGSDGKYTAQNVSIDSQSWYFRKRRHQSIKDLQCRRRYAYTRGLERTLQRCHTPVSYTHLESPSKFRIGVPITKYIPL